MDKVLEESGKWFLNVSLAIVVTFLLQPIAKGTIDKTSVIYTLIGASVFFAFGNVLLYLSKKVRKDGV